MSTESNDAMSVSFADPELERLRASAKAWEDTASVYARNDLDRQADIAQLRARLSEVEAERDALRGELARWESGQRIKGLPQIGEVPDGLQLAAALIRAQGTEGGEEHDELLREAGMRLRDLADAARYLLAQRDGLLRDLDQSRVHLRERTEQRDALQRQRDEVWHRIDLWSDDPDTGLDHLLDVWTSHEKALAQVEAWRPVVEAAIAYENRWRRYAGIQPGADSVDVRLAKAKAHQALLDATRTLDSTTPGATDGD